MALLTQPDSLWYNYLHLKPIVESYIPLPPPVLNSEDIPLLPPVLNSDGILPIPAPVDVEMTLKEETIERLNHIVNEV